MGCRSPGTTSTRRPQLLCLTWRLETKIDLYVNHLFGSAHGPRIRGSYPHTVRFCPRIPPLAADNLLGATVPGLPATRGTKQRYKRRVGGPFRRKSVSQHRPPRLNVETPNAEFSIRPNVHTNGTAFLASQRYASSRTLKTSTWMFHCTFQI